MCDTELRGETVSSAHVPIVCITTRVYLPIPAADADRYLSERGDIHTKYRSFYTIVTCLRSAARISASIKHYEYTLYRDDGDIIIMGNINNIISWCLAVRAGRLWFAVANSRGGVTRENTSSSWSSWAESDCVLGR